MFTAAVYIRHEESLINENFAIVSEAKDHSHIAAHTCINKVIELIIEKHCHLKDFQNLDLYIWSDGCSAQFRSKYVFALTSLFPSKFNVTRYYNERHHRKRPINGIGGCVEKVVYRAVMAGREVIKTPEGFAKCANRLLKVVRCVYQPIEEMLEDPEYIKEAPYSTNMQSLKVHIVHRVITRNGFHCMKLYFTATNGESFHDQWYKKDDETEPCGHSDVVGNYRIDTICANCFDGKNGEDWFHCPRCCWSMVAREMFLCLNL